MKKPIILLSVLLVLALAAVLVGPGFVDWDRYKDQVTERIGAATGLRVAIDGDMDLALLPRPSFKASGVRIADLSSVVTPDMARVDALEVQVALLPLLSGDVQVQRVALLKPHLTLEARPEGGLNWSLDAGASVPDSVQLERVNIEDGVLVWRDGAEGREERIEDIDISLSAASLRGPVRMVGTATVRGLPLTVDLSTSRVTAAGALPMGMTLGLQGVDGTVRLAGIVSPETGFQGEVSGETGSLLPVLRKIWPEAALPAGAEQPFSFESSIRSLGDRVDLTGLTASLGDGTASGTVKATLSEVPRFDAALVLSRIDLDGWLADTAASAGGEAGIVPVVTSLGGARFAIPDRMTVTFDIAVDSITLRGALIRQARFEGFLDGGTLSVSRLTAQLPGGSDVALAGTVQSLSGVPQFDFDAQAAANDLRGVLAWLGYDVEGVPSARLRRFSGSASITGRPNDFQVGGFDFVVDGTRASGGLAYVNSGRPGIGLRLNATRINLDAYRPQDATPLLGATLLQRLADAMAMADANLDITMAGLTVDGVTLRDIRIDATLSGGAVTIRQAAVGNAAGVAGSLQGSVAALDPLSDADLAFRLEATDPARLTRALGIGGQTPIDRLDAMTLGGRISGDAEALTLEVMAEAGDGTAELGGRIADPWAAPIYDFSLRVRHPALEAMLAIWAPAYRPRGPLGSLDLFARIAGSPEALVIDGVQGTIGPTALAGQFVLDRTGDRPSIEAVLRASELEAAPWITRSARTGARTPRRWSSEAFDLSILSGFDGSLALTATGLAVGPFDIAEPALEARLKDGVLDLTGLSGRLFGGSFGASGKLNAVATRPELQFTLDLVGADLAEALTTTAGVEAFAGALDFGLEIESSGASPAELVGGLSGIGLLAARDGEIRGIDLAETASGLGGLTDPLAFLDLQQRTLTAGATAFGSLNATFALADGIATTEDLRLVGQHGVAEGRGVFDVSRWQIDLTTEFDLTGLPDAPAFGLRLIGPPDDPERVLQTADLQAFIARRAADAVSQRYDRGSESPNPLPETN